MLLKMFGNSCPESRKGNYCGCQIVYLALYIYIQGVNLFIWLTLYLHVGKTQFICESQDSKRSNHVCDVSYQFLTGRLNSAWSRLTKGKELNRSSLVMNGRMNGLHQVEIFCWHFRDSDRKFGSTEMVRKQCFMLHSTGNGRDVSQVILDQSRHLLLDGN